MAIIPSEAFGTSGGFDQYDQGANLRATTQHTQAMTRLGNAQAAHAEQEAIDQHNMAQIMSGLGAPAPAGQEDPKNPVSLLDRVERAATVLMDKGYYKAGTDWAVKATTMRAHYAQIKKEQSDERFKTMDQQEKALSTINGILVGIDGPESFMAAKDAWKQGRPNDPIPPQFDHYDPAIIDALRHGTKEGLKQLDEKRKELRDADLEDARLERLRDAKFRIQLEERRVKEYERRGERLEKGGGTKISAAGAPSTMMVSAANALISEEFPDVKGTSAALAVASDAKVRMAANHGIGMTEALQQAYAKAKADGDFETTQGTKILGFGGSDKTTYVGGGKTAENPLSMPKKVGDAPPPASAFKAGRFYQTPKGVLKWTGKNFVGTAGLAPRSAPSSRAGADPNEEDQGAE